MIHYAELDAHHAHILQNYAKLNLPIYQGSTDIQSEATNGRRGVAAGAFPRHAIEPPNSETGPDANESMEKLRKSRWVPAVEELIIRAAKAKLDPMQFPVVLDRSQELDSFSSKAR